MITNYRASNAIILYHALSRFTTDTSFILLLVMKKYHDMHLSNLLCQYNTSCFKYRFKCLKVFFLNLSRCFIWHRDMQIHLANVLITKWIPFQKIFDSLRHYIWNLSFVFCLKAGYFRCGRHLLSLFYQM